MDTVLCLAIQDIRDTGGKNLKGDVADSFGVSESALKENDDHFKARDHRIQNENMRIIPSR